MAAANVVVTDPPLPVAMATAPDGPRLTTRPLIVAAGPPGESVTPAITTCLFGPCDAATVCPGARAIDEAAEPDDEPGAEPDAEPGAAVGMLIR